MVFVYKWAQKVFAQGDKFSGTGFKNFWVTFDQKLQRRIV